MKKEQSNEEMFKEAQYLYPTNMGDDVFFYAESMVIRFRGKRRVVSSSNLNGGSRDDLRFVFNNSCGRNPNIIQKKCCGLRGKNIVEHYSSIAKEDLGLPLDCSTGMGTAALIENAAVAKREHMGVSVMAIATGGIDVNGGRAGDEASIDEIGRALEERPGTINIFLLIDALLDNGALTRAIVTATEAKTAALQELMANSMYSEDLATGSGTDTIIAVSNEEHPIRLFNTGKHVKLGEMIGRTVKEAVTKALAKQAGMTPQRQGSIAWQAKRYKLTKEEIETYLCELMPEMPPKKAEPELDTLLYKDKLALGYVAALLHLIDQHRWQLLPKKEFMETSGKMLDLFRSSYGLTTNSTPDKTIKHPDTSVPDYQKRLHQIKLSLAEIVLQKMQENEDKK